MQPQEKIGVVLLNLGGPEKLADVEPFLYNLFSDRKIIRLGPWFMQKIIARFIAKKRAPKSAKSYELIGGGSPLLSITKTQASALEKDLHPHGSFALDIAMRYWPPYATEVLNRFQKEGITKIVTLTLYPHYSKATTGSSVDDLRKTASSFSPSFDIVDITAYPDNPDYVASLAESITTSLKTYSDSSPELVYSAHSLPVKFIEEGDPYLDDIAKTITAVEKITGKKGHLCFQSRSGPVEWLTPSTPDMLEKLANDGCKEVLMVPISFVSDHVETLYEIDIQYKELADDLGIALKRTESLNDKPQFVKALKELVLEACKSKSWL